MNYEAGKTYYKYVHEFILGQGYVFQPPVMVSGAEIQAELDSQGGQKYQNVWYVPIDNDPKRESPLTVGYYMPTPAFHIITEHVCVMRVEDMTPVAIVGSSAEDDMLPATMHYAHLFASAPAILAQNQRADDLITRIDAMIEEAMQQWYGVSSLHMPANMLELAQMRDAIQEYNTFGKEEQSHG